MRMASASLARRKSLTAQQALARLHEMDAADSDGGEQPTDASSDESEMETEQEPNTPPRRMRRGTGKPSPSQTAKGGASANRSRFTARAGPTESAKRKITSVLQSFLCLLDMGMLLTITECTVHQARRTELDWKLASDELMAFISILFVRAIMCPVGAIADCWSENFLVPVIKETMSRDRFLSIMQHLRFDDKDTRAERVKTDRFAAISDIWTRFTKNCAESFTPGEHMTIDEQLFPTKVRCPFTQYIASKPEKIGIKFWMVTDLETKYVCNVSPYLGKAPGRQKGERQAENVVMSLMEPFLGDGRSVTTDNFFISLSHRLLQRNTTLLGTVNKVRSELPSSAKDTAEREEFSMSVFRMARMYSVRAATRRWPVAVFYNMLDLAAVNAYILYKVCTGWKGKRRLFLSLLAKELRCQFMQQKAIERERNAAAAAAAFAAVPGCVQTTQCQVQESCNRNRSRFTCVKCHKFTCAKCRDDGHWVCKRCKHRLKQTDKLCGRVTAPKTKRREEEKNNFRVKLAIKALVTKGTLVQTKGTGASGSFKLNKKQSEAVKKPAKKAAPKAKKPAAKKPAAAKKPKKAAASAAKRPAAAKKSPKKAKKPAVAKKAAKSPKKAKKPAAAKKATKSPKKAKAAKPKVAKPKATKAKKAAPKKK